MSSLETRNAHGTNDKINCSKIRARMTKWKSINSLLKEFEQHFDLNNCASAYCFYNVF